MSNSYIKRHAEGAVEQLSKMFGAVLVAGPQQVGKTTMLQEVTRDIGYVTLDDTIVRASAVEESSTFFKDNPPPVFIDEIQKAPIDAFAVLDKIPNMERGAGGVICLYDKLVTLKGKDKVIPIQYL